MTFGSSPRDSSNIPLSSSYVPNVGLVALKGSANTNTDASSNQSAAAMIALDASGYTSGTLQTARTDNNVGTALPVLGMASVVFTVNMVGFTGTVTFKASEDGTNYDPINVAQAGTGTISTTAVGSTTTSIHCYDASIAGYQSVEAVTSGVSAGNVTVTAHAIPINIAPRTVNVAGTITASNASIGTDGSAIPTSSTLIGASDGTNLQGLLAQSTSNPNLRVALYNGANQQVSQKTMANSLPVVIASDQSTVLVSQQVTSSGGSTPYHNLSGASTNATNVKAAACQMYGYAISNTNASARYVKFYDKATSPTIGTDTPKHTVQIPGNGVVIRAFPEGMKFTTGFGWGTTTGVADSDTGAVGSNDLVVDFTLNS